MKLLREELGGRDLEDLWMSAIDGKFTYGLALRV